jgi:integrase/recombinase XerD
MRLARKASILSEAQIETALAFLAKGRHAARNRVIFLLSVDGGLGASEIARLTWWMTNDSEGNIGWSFCLPGKASQQHGRMIPVSTRLREAMIEYRNSVPNAGGRVIGTERQRSTSPRVIINLFQRWYRRLGFDGCSSHSGGVPLFIRKLARPRRLESP